MSESTINVAGQPSAPASESAEILKATIRESAPAPEQVKSTVRESASSSGHHNIVSNPFATDGALRCSQCGYPIGEGMTECPVCHAPTGWQNSAQKPTHREPERHSAPGHGGFRPGAGGTINPWATPVDDSFFTLRRLPWQNEKVNYDPVSYSGDAIVLNRANTDANNNSITSREQAIITNENGEWYIENRSDLQTTLIRADRRIQLEDGDVIVLGNRMFEFRKG